MSTLSATPHVAFVPIADKDKALAFYRDQLGLALVEDQFYVIEAGRSVFADANR